MPKEEAELFLEGIHQERHALRRMLKYDGELGLVGMVIYLDGEIKGFTAGERPGSIRWGVAPVYRGSGIGAA